jgi:hypothetical protein
MQRKHGCFEYFIEFNLLVAMLRLFFGDGALDLE